MEEKSYEKKKPHIFKAELLESGICLFSYSGSYSGISFVDYVSFTAHRRRCR